MNAMTGLGSFAVAALGPAEVLGPETGGHAILRDDQRRHAALAYSCLVVPEVGDIVLVGEADGTSYIIAVLHRRGEAPMRLAVPDGARLESPGGSLAIAADRLVLAAKERTVAAESLNVTGARVQARFGAVSLVAQAIESVAERILGRFRRSHRFVEEGEQLRARELDYRASGHANLKGDTVAVHGGLIVKIDGGQIHMG